jgi:hypothetical protein
MIFRPYDPARDRKAVFRIYKEVGWYSPSWEEGIQDRFLASGQALVAEMNGEAECLVTSTPGRMRYLDEDLRFAGLSSVTTSHVARRQGAARSLVARSLAADAAAGALVSGMGVFDQGFYDAVGYGTLGYDHWVGFDPATLRVDRRPRPPVRLTEDDLPAVHANRLARRRAHGGLCLDSPTMTEVGLFPYDKCFALGYRDGKSGEVSHHLAFESQGGENGPYQVRWLAYLQGEQFLELMALLKSLADQVQLVSVAEPPGIQLQDLLERPLRHELARRKSDFACYNSAHADHQARVLDVPGCLAQTKLDRADLRFTLRLSDPVEALLAGERGWRGCAGDYVVTLGPSSGAERGCDPRLPVLVASVNAFTRLWLGVLPATGLAITDDLSGPAALLDQLDCALRLPPPHFDWSGL